MVDWTKKMLVESDPHETRVAILESDRLTEIFVERAHARGVVGNIYKGRVNRVLPGMQAAFVDIGLERDAFLYISDVASVAMPADEDGVAEYLEGQDSEARVKERDELSIGDLLRDGQELVVQVTKDPLANKGARVTTHVTLPSRLLVLLPTMTHRGLSRRIEDGIERERLRTLVEGLESEYGLIVRTAADGRELADFEADLSYLTERWQTVAQACQKVPAPTLLHRDFDISLRVVRDLFSDEYSVLWVDGEETYERIVEFLDQVQPSLVGKVRLDRGDTGLFDRFRIEQEIEAALASKVWLKSGGYLVINQTEALVAIDVNTGRFLGRRDLEDTVLETNLEAVEEIVRQIRLRDLSGILVIDLIDMTEQEHRDQVFSALERELRKDRAKSKVLNISEFGLVEVTRKRSSTNLERLLTRPCPYCRGAGRIKTTATICLRIRREVLRGVRSGPQRELLLRVHPEVAEALQTHESAVFRELVETLGSRILLQSDPDLHREQFDLSEI